MLDGKTVAVVVPAYNEEPLIETTVAGIPDFVDRVIVVDDASRDGTGERVHAGAAIVSGYRRALEEGIDVTCVMAADNQMDPNDLEAIVAPVARGEAEYA